MANFTFSGVPNDLTDPVALRRFLERMVEQLNVAFNDSATVSYDTVDSINSVNAETDSAVSTELESGNSSFADRLTTLETDVDSLNTSSSSQDSRVTDLEDNLDQTAIADVSLSASSPSPAYSQVEAVAVFDDTVTLESKVNEIITALETANILT